MWGELGCWLTPHLVLNKNMIHYYSKWEIPSSQVTRGWKPIAEKKALEQIAAGFNLNQKLN